MEPAYVMITISFDGALDSATQFQRTYKTGLGWGRIFFAQDLIIFHDPDTNKRVKTSCDCQGESDAHYWRWF